MSMPKWFVRRTTHGITTVAHIFESTSPYDLLTTEINYSRPICSLHTQVFRDDKLVRANPDLYKQCPQCLKALAERIKLRLQGKGKLE